MPAFLQVVLLSVSVLEALLLIGGYGVLRDQARYIVDLEESNRQLRKTWW